jgi:hypothetical protein
VGALKWSLQVTGLWAVFGSYCSQGRLQLGPEVNHCQFVQGGQIHCCFCQEAAVLPYSCNSGCSAPPPARWGNSVLNSALRPMRLTQWSTMALLLGGWLVTPPLLSAFVTFHVFVHWELSKLSHPCSPGQVQHSTPPHFSVRLQFIDYAFHFCLGEGVQSAKGAVWVYVPGRVSRGVMSGVWCSSVGSAGLHRFFETDWQGEIVCCFSQGRHFLGLGSAQLDTGRLSTS